MRNDTTSTTMKHISFLLLSAALCLTTVSCEDDIRSGEETATVTVSLQAEGGSSAVDGAVICLNCRTGADKTSFLMERNAPGHYVSEVPCNSVPTDDFIEVLLNGKTYTYTPENTCFDGGKLYGYSLELTPEGLKPVTDSDISITDWETVDVTVELANMGD